MFCRWGPVVYSEACILTEIYAKECKCKCITLTTTLWRRHLGGDGQDILVTFLILFLRVARRNSAKYAAGALLRCELAGIQRAMV
jgi:hypothetical protein